MSSVTAMRFRFEVALYLGEVEAHSAFLIAAKSETPTAGLNIGDEAFLETAPSINGKAIIL